MVKPVRAKRLYSRAPIPIRWASLKLATEVMSDAKRRARIMPCGAEAKPDETCLAKFATTFGRRLWRRPLDKTEVATLVAVGSKATKTLEKEPLAGAQYLLAALLQASYVLSGFGGAAATGDGVHRIQLDAIHPVD